jgi:SPP1 gp7 family putative phage head morphogenesis protein
MPIESCLCNKKQGFRWGPTGVCFCGPDGYKRALSVSRAIKAQDSRVTKSQRLFKQLIEARQIQLLENTTKRLSLVKVRATDATPAQMESSLNFLGNVIRSFTDLTPQERQLFDELSLDLAVQGLKDAAKLHPRLSDNPQTWTAAFRAEAPRLRQSLADELARQYIESETNFTRDLAQTLAEEFAKDADKEQLSLALQSRYKVGKSSADRRAEQAISTSIELVSRTRQQDAGITEYIWRTVQDSQVRPEHRARNGMKFSYDNPPADGPPGTPWNCRCFAEPVIPEQWADEFNDMAVPPASNPLSTFEFQTGGPIDLEELLAS